MRTPAEERAEELAEDEATGCARVPRAPRCPGGADQQNLKDCSESQQDGHSKKPLPQQPSTASSARVGTAGVTGQFWSVTWHQKGQRFQAMCRICKPAKYLGLHSTTQAGTDAVVSHFKERHRGHKLPDAVDACKPVPKAVLKQDLERFQELYSTFKHCVPGDLDAACQAATRHANMHAADSLYEMLSIMGKIGPFKEALFAAWQEHWHARDAATDVPNSPEARAVLAAAVLRTAAQKLDGRDFQAWSDSTGRRNARHSGHLKALQDWMIIQSADEMSLQAKGVKETKGAKKIMRTKDVCHVKDVNAPSRRYSSSSASKVTVRSELGKPARRPAAAHSANAASRLRRSKVVEAEPALEFVHLGQQGKKYQLLDGHAAAQKLAALAVAADLFSAALDAPPSTLLQWTEAVTKLKTELGDLCQRLGVPSVVRLNHEGGYQFLWTFRAMALARMARATVCSCAAESGSGSAPGQLCRWQGLRACSDPASDPVSVQTFLNSFPDEHSWARRFMPRGDRTVHGLVTALSWQREPLELLTMWMCLLMDSSLRQLSPQWIRDRRSSLQEAALEHRSRHGFWPHPTVCVATVQMQESQRKSVTSKVSATSATSAKASESSAVAALATLATLPAEASSQSMSDILQPKPLDNGSCEAETAPGSCRSIGAASTVWDVSSQEDAPAGCQPKMNTPRKRQLECSDDESEFARRKALKVAWAARAVPPSWAAGASTASVWSFDESNELKISPVKVKDDAVSPSAMAEETR